MKAHADDLALRAWVADATATAPSDWREVPSFAVSRRMNRAYVRADDAAGDGECIIVVVDDREVELWRELRDGEWFSHLSTFYREKRSA
jgi:ApbE superfamily uncharacterized protein (UPF0280 family)